jgi:hypothetical protein
MKTLLLLAFVCGFAVLVGRQSSASLRGTDFPDFYCAARMLAEGHGHQLYDADLQRQYQARYTGRVGTLYIHPPFEAVLYYGAAWLPLRRAYLLWSLLNLAFLAAAVRRLASTTLLTWDWQILLVASLTFVPCLLCFLQGQDSLLLLLLVVLAFTAFRQGRGFACGCWLGLGLFKFEIVLPIALVLALSQSRSITSALARGFGLIALLLAGVSAGIAGWSVFSAYPKFLLHLQAQPFAGIAPLAMANFRGLAYFFFQREGEFWPILVVTTCSALTLIKTVNDWKKAHRAFEINHAESSVDELDLAFGGTVLFAVLVSYHLNPHDLGLLLLPVFLFLHRSLVKRSRLSTSANRLAVALVAILFLPPLHLWALSAGSYALIGLPIIALLLAARPDSSESNSVLPG